MLYTNPYFICYLPDGFDEYDDTYEIDTDNEDRAWNEVFSRSYLHALFSKFSLDHRDLTTHYRVGLSDLFDLIMEDLYLIWEHHIYEKKGKWYDEITVDWKEIVKWTTRDHLIAYEIVKDPNIELDIEEYE